MKKYFLETSVIVNFLRDRYNAVDVIKNLEGDLVSSYICLAELYEGVFRIKDRNRAERAVLNFFTGLGKVYGLDREVAENFGRVRANLKRKGRVIEDLDILLAATCLTYDLIMVTYNPGHFERVGGLKVLGLKTNSSD